MCSFSNKENPDGAFFETSSTCDLQNGNYVLLATSSLTEQSFTRRLHTWAWAFTILILVAET